MKITKNQLLAHKLCSKDITRSALQNILFDGQTATAADGHKLVMIKKVDADPCETFVLIPGSLAAKASKEKCNDFEVLNEEGISIKGQNSTYHGEPVDKQFPPLQDILPDSSKGSNASVSFNAQYMRDICDLIVKSKIDKHNNNAKITFDASNPNPKIIIESKGADEEIYFLLMPLRA